jgi:very-short-patch-repair endonuclease
MESKRRRPTPLNPPLSGGTENARPYDSGVKYFEYPAPPLTRGGGEGLAVEAADAPFLPYNKTLIALARQNRKNPTAAESKIWNEVLRMRKLAKYKFLRQKPIAGYIVDFYCSELSLVIEIDGESHAETVEYDEERTRILGSLGLTVARFTNDDILRNIEGVYNDVIRTIPLGIEQSCPQKYRKISKTK